jgi:response regulator RpfG family c-di-GMP phosphodiesterase
MDKRIKVYLVDDDPVFSVIAKVTLSKLYENLDFNCFANGEEALNSLMTCPEEQFPNLLFLDINMPIMDGWEFLSSLDQMVPQAFPICMTSSSIDPEDKKRAIANPRIVDFIEKPFDRKRVSALIDTLMD